MCVYKCSQAVIRTYVHIFTACYQLQKINHKEFSMVDTFVCGVAFMHGLYSNELVGGYQSEDK